MKRRLSKVVFSILMLGVTCVAQSRETLCDFSKYNYSWADHFLPNGFRKVVKPKYPAVARAVKANGSVQVDVIFDAKGNVREACAVSGHPLLHAAAVRAARETKFKRNFNLSMPQPISLRSKYMKAELYYTFVL